MIPVIIQKRGAVHLAEEAAAGNFLLGRSVEPPRYPHSASVVAQPGIGTPGGVRHGSGTKSCVPGRIPAVTSG